jgi:uncharacterized repeat protein (TIGR01451 family)
MKKALTISFLAFALSLAGCKSADTAKPESAATAKRESVAAAPRRASFWDKDLRPVMRAAPQPAQTESKDEEAPAQPTTTEPTAGSEPVRRGRYSSSRRGAQPEVMTASIQELPSEPARSVVARPGATVPVGIAGLVSVDETGENGLSMTFPRADYGILQVDKAMPRQVRLNQPFDYVIKVSNLTDATITDVTLTETFSKDFTFKGSEPTATVQDNKLMWQIDSIGPRGSRSLKISGIATNTKQLEHCTAITHTVRDCAVAEVVEPALQLTQVLPPESLICEPIPVEFVVTNTGSGVAQDVQITDTLPAGVQTADGKDRIVVDVGSLLSGESRRFAVKIRATKTGPFNNKAVATGTGSLRAESGTMVTTVRQPVLTITKSGSHRQFLGRPVSYEITVTNRGDGPARETIVEDTIPAEVTSIEATAGAQFSVSKLVWELGTLEPNASKKVKVSYIPAREGEVMAIASASAYCAETVTDGARTVVTGIAATRLEVIDVEDPVEVGNTTTFEITAVNQGSAADRDIRITCVLDERMQYVSSAGATAGSAMGKTVTFAPLTTLEPKAKATWRVVVRGSRPGDLVFRVSMRTGGVTVPMEQTEVTRVYQQVSGGN